MLASQYHYHFLTAAVCRRRRNRDIRNSVITDGVGNRLHFPYPVFLLTSKRLDNLQIMNETGVWVGDVHRQTHIVVFVQKRYLKRKRVKFDFPVFIFADTGSLVLYIRAHLPPAHALVLPGIDQGKHGDLHPLTEEGWLFFLNSLTFTKLTMEKR